MYIFAQTIYFGCESGCGSAASQFVNVGDRHEHEHRKGLFRDLASAVCSLQSPASDLQTKASTRWN